MAILPFRLGCTIHTVGSVPGQADAPTVTQVSSSELMVEFDAVAEATSYDVRFAPRIPQSGGDLSTGWWNITTGFTSGNNITGCWAAKSYDVQVRAANGAGAGEWSTSGNASTATAASNKSATVNISITTPDEIHAICHNNTKWNFPSFPSSPKIMTYSFPASGSYYEDFLGSSYDTWAGRAYAANHSEFPTAAQDAARRGFMHLSRITLVQFVEITEDATTHADLRLSCSSATGSSIGESFYPSSVYIGGDTWFRTGAIGSSSNTPGHITFKYILHEMGHGVGLGHLHDGSYNIDGQEYDAEEYSVMSYKSYPGGPNSYTMDNFPHTYMQVDTDALQQMYGAREFTGDMTFTWNPSTGETSINGVGQGTPSANKVLVCCWGGTGVNTYDFTGYTPSTITYDLDAGDRFVLTSTQQVDCNVGGSPVLAHGNVYNARAQSGVDSAIDGVANA